MPQGSLIYAIGDIHGRRDLLDALLAMIVADAQHIKAQERVLVFLGDYIDRGADSAGVIDRLLAGPPEGFQSVCLKGNHEAIMLDFLERPAQLNLWVENGAAATLNSYGLDAYGFDWHWGDEAGCRDDLLAAMPASHRAFLEGLRLSYQCGDYFFAHAGVRPDVPLEAQRAEDLIWIRSPFLESDADFGKIVVHGHTPGERPVVRPNRIGIDTGAWMSGTLTALRLHGTARAFLATPAG